MMTEREIYFWISRVDGWSFRKYSVLIEKYGTITDLARCFLTDAKFFESVLSTATYAQARASFDEKTISAEIRALEDAKIKFVTPADELYPEGVATMSYDRPFVLYYAGNAELFRSRGLAVVGTRRVTYYGTKTAKAFVADLKNSGLTIVSGLADGIDTAAHEAALDNGMYTIAVLGSGISRVTPSGNVGLARKIVKAGGLIVSEFLPDFGGSRYSYPQRNRLIAAMSEGVLVVEAGEKSGALYTVDHAVEQGKEVFLVPHNLDSKNFAGILRSYREGKGNFVYDAADIADTLHLQIHAENIAETSQSLSLTSQKILDSLEERALNYDSLFESAGLSPSDFAVELTNLEIIGLIESRGGLYYKK